ncbi:MAG: DNA repair protein RecN [Rhodospirillales bacterium]|nr:DNA repair protein RecN [Rhodospirillales bacterium]
MLRTLSIRDVVLMEKLDIDFHSGLCVLTGETGAGKSILLDALGLALGVRADSALVRHGAKQASVAAEFDVDADHPACRILAEHGLDGFDDTLILRRALGADGRSHAFVNDRPVSVSLLRQAGAALVEIHGQFESQKLLSPAAHRALLDSYGDLGTDADHTVEAYRTWLAATEARAAAEEAWEGARRDEEFLRYAVDEFAALDPQPGEDAALAAERAVLMHGEKLLEALNNAVVELGSGQGVEASLRGAARHLEKAAEKADGRLDGVIAALDRAVIEAAEVSAGLERLSGAIDLDPRHLEGVEERLFALRALARKHGVEVDDLPATGERLTAQFAALRDGGAAVERLRRDEAASRDAFIQVAGDLSAARREAAARLDEAVARELGPLKLGKAVFATRVTPLDEGDWSESGADRVVFQAATNPGAPPGPLNRIASGGELARFALALKVVLAGADPVPTIIFDEVDSGVGGAVAAAVGERLARLAEDFQVVGVTHSPQVAARGVNHWRVSKADAGPGIRTTVDALSETSRTEEIARMLAGARITDAARAAAESLLQGHEA